MSVYDPNKAATLADGIFRIGGPVSKYLEILR